MVYSLPFQWETTLFSFVCFLRSLLGGGGGGVEVEGGKISLSKSLLNISNMTGSRHFVFEKLGVTSHNSGAGAGKGSVRYNI
jgi:hypothetical protein